MIDYSDRNDKVTAQALQEIRERMTEEMGFQTFPVIDDADVTFCGGRVFQSREAVTGKARSPMVEKRMRRTTGDDDEAERRRCFSVILIL